MYQKCAAHDTFATSVRGHLAVLSFTESNIQDTLRLKRLNLHQSGQLLCGVRVPEVNPPAGATEGCGGEQRPIRREVTGRQEVDGLMGPSRQVPHERVRPQTPQTHHLTKVKS